MFYQRLVMAILFAISLTTVTLPVAYSATLPAASPVGMTKININKATLDDLLKIKGMSKTKANNMISYRTQHGGFKSVDDLKNVKGFKKMKKESRDLIQNQLSMS